MAGHRGVLGREEIGTGNHWHPTNGYVPVRHGDSGERGFHRGAAVPASGRPGSHSGKFGGRTVSHGVKKRYEA